MPNYDFKSLSSNEFEMVARDLLQEHFGIILESFTNGRDEGIDLKGVIEEEKTLIIQCKHYANSKFSNLKSEMIKSEAQKIAKMKVEHYVLVTSIGLTPGNKTTLEEIIRDVTTAQITIFGKEDLNNQLGLYPDIEKRNFKLWLTSQAVLDRMLHASIYNASEHFIIRIQDKLKYYVQNEGYFQAKETLSCSNFCIISGAPGIGKTTLAEVLIAEYMANGYEFLYFTEEDLKEARSLLHTEKKQVFYFDDFLGQTRFEKRGRNEEQILLDFLDMIQRSKNGKLIMTTREYILNQAKNEYEKIGNSTIDYFKCILDLEKYSILQRAKIFYNHLYFSDLTKPFLDALFEQTDYLVSFPNYLKIIRHKNFSPRIIEFMTDRRRIGQYSTPEEFIEAFIENLENPHYFGNMHFRNTFQMLLKIY